MKRVNNLYYNICKFDNIRYIYDNVIYKNTRNKRKILNFDNYYIENLFYIKKVLSNKQYVPSKYNIFLIKEPKERIIMSQSIYDKLINHLVSYYILKPVIEPLLIDTNVATRIGKGTNYAIKKFKEYYNYMKIKYNKFYILKFDISKYFYNIDHQILKKLLISKIKDKNAIKIIFDIIDSTNDKYVNKKIIEIAKRNNNFDSIPIYKKGKGLPIGNMTSQILAIFYMNGLDNYIKENLKINFYIRYMDDGIIFCENKEYLKLCLKKIDWFIKVNYKLELNSKTRIYSSKETIIFLGFKYRIINNKLIIKINDHTKKKFKKKIKKFKGSQKYKSIIGSYKGLFKYGMCNNLIYKNLGRISFKK